MQQAVTRPWWRRPRIWCWTALLVGLVLAWPVWMVWQQAPLLPLASGYVAKQMARGHFINGYDPWAELLEDDPSIAWVDYELDHEAGRVSTSVFGFYKRQAIASSTGCVLLVDADGDLHQQMRVSMRPAVPQFEAARLGDVQARALHMHLDQAFGPAARGSRRTRAIVVLHKGRLLCERYADGWHEYSRFHGWSMSKSVNAVLVGRHLFEGLLRLDAKALHPSWSASDPRAAITLEQLLRMQSGLDFDESYGGGPSDVIRMLFACDDTAAYAAGRPLRHKPGEQVHYSSGDTVLAAYAQRYCYKQADAYNAMPQELLFGPLGMHSALIEQDAAGTYELSSGCHATARDWAVFGQFLLQDGVWNGQRLLPEGFMQHCRSASGPRGDYGMGFWLNGPPGTETHMPQLPADAFFCWGHFRQLVFVVPSADLVVVRLGLSKPDAAWDMEWFVAGVLAILQSGEGS